LGERPEARGVHNVSPSLAPAGILRRTDATPCDIVLRLGARSIYHANTQRMAWRRSFATATGVRNRQLPCGSTKPPLRVPHTLLAGHVSYGVECSAGLVMKFNPLKEKRK